MLTKTAIGERETKNTSADTKFGGDMKKLIESAVEQMPASLTILDAKGTILYYNQYAESIVDRKPEYIGRDVRDFHIAKSNQKLDRILEEYAKRLKGRAHLATGYRRRAAAGKGGSVIC